MKLVVGCGDRRIPGFKHHDVLPLEGIDYCCELFDLPIHIGRSTVEEIHMTHVLEHFAMKDVQKALKVLHGLLKEEGKLYLEVPNLEWDAQQIVKNPTNRKIVEYIFGGQKDKWDFHYNGFTEDILIGDLIEADFRIDEIRPNSSIECWATKV